MGGLARWCLRIRILFSFPGSQCLWRWAGWWVSQGALAAASRTCSYLQFGAQIASAKKSANAEEDIVAENYWVSYRRVSVGKAER